MQTNRIDFYMHLFNVTLVLAGDLLITSVSCSY